MSNNLPFNENDLLIRDITQDGKICTPGAIFQRTVQYKMLGIFGRLWPEKTPVKHLGLIQFTINGTPMQFDCINASNGTYLLTDDTWKFMFHLKPSQRNVLTIDYDMALPAQPALWSSAIAISGETLTSVHFLPHESDRGRAQQS